MNIFKRAAALALLVSAAGCRGYLNVQPQGEVIPETDEEFAAIIHNRLRDIEGGGDEYVIGNMDAIKHLEGCADNLDAAPAPASRSSPARRSTAASVPTRRAGRSSETAT